MILLEMGARDSSFSLAQSYYDAGTPPDYDDLPSENADIEHILDELEETLEEYAEDMGYLQVMPHKDALRKTYSSDPAFFNDLYDEKLSEPTEDPRDEYNPENLYEDNEAMKLTKKHLKKLIADVISESDDPISKAHAAIEKKFGKGSVIDSGSGDKLSNDWMKFVLRNQRYQDVLLDAWDHMVGGDNPSDVKKLYLNDLDNDISIAGAITFYGRRIRQGESYLSGTQIAEKIAAERARREEERLKPKPKKPFERPRFGKAFNPETGQWVTGYDETWH